VKTWSNKILERLSDKNKPFIGTYFGLSLEIGCPHCNRYPDIDTVKTCLKKLESQGKVEKILKDFTGRNKDHTWQLRLAV
jgi:hypothetical protein